MKRSVFVVVLLGLVLLITFGAYEITGNYIISQIGVVKLTSCGTISEPGHYILMNDIFISNTCFKIQSDNVSLDLNNKILFYENNSVVISGTAVEIEDFNNITVFGGIFKGNWPVGIHFDAFLNNISNFVAKNNSFEDSYHGVYITGTGASVNTFVSNVLVENNIFNQVRTAVTVKMARDVVINQNYFEGGSQTSVDIIYLANNVSVLYNYFNSSSYGIGGQTIASGNISIFNNVFNNITRAMYFSGVFVNITGNNISHSDRGIYRIGRGIVTQNNFDSNNIAIGQVGSASFSNNLFKNTKNFTIFDIKGGSRWNVSYSNNYAEVLFYPSCHFSDPEYCGKYQRAVNYYGDLNPILSYNSVNVSSDLEGYYNLNLFEFLNQTSSPVINRTVLKKQVPYLLPLMENGVEITLYGISLLNFNNVTILENGVNCTSCILLENNASNSVRFAARYPGAYSILLDEVCFPNVKIPCDSVSDGVVSGYKKKCDENGTAWDSVDTCSLNCNDGHKKEGDKCVLNIPKVTKLNASFFELENNNTRRTTALRFKQTNKTLIVINESLSKVGNFSLEQSLANESREFVIVRDLIVNSTKSLYLEKKDASSNAVCFADRELDNSSELMSDCTKLVCPGTLGNYSCDVSNNTFIISGLKHSGVIEDFVGCGDGACLEETCSSCAADCGVCPSGDSSSSGGGGSGGGGGGSTAANIINTSLGGGGGGSGEIEQSNDVDNDVDGISGVESLSPFSFSDWIIKNKALLLGVFALIVFVSIVVIFVFFTRLSIVSRRKKNMVSVLNKTTLKKKERKNTVKDVAKENKKVISQIEDLIKKGNLHLKSKKLFLAEGNYRRASELYGSNGMNDPVLYKKLLNLYNKIEEVDSN